MAPDEADLTRAENLDPKDPRQMAEHYEAMLTAVREVAERLRARIEELRDRFPDAFPASESGASDSEGGIVPPTDSELREPEAR